MQNSWVMSVLRRTRTAAQFPSIRCFHQCDRAFSNAQEVLNRINVVRDRRLNAGRMAAGVAAYSDSDMFKGDTTNKPKAKRWDGKLA
jgi:hypothetical protein